MADLTVRGKMYFDLLKGAYGERSGDSDDESGDTDSDNDAGTKCNDNRA